MNTLVEAKLFFARSFIPGPMSQTSLASCFRSKAELFFARFSKRRFWLPLLVAIALVSFGMLLTILFPVIGMRLTPLLLTRSHIFGVGGIIADSFAVIIAAAPTLTIRRATDALLWSITGRLKNLLAVSATPVRTHARLLFSSGSKFEPLSKTKPSSRRI